MNKKLANALLAVTMIGLMAMPQVALATETVEKQPVVCSEEECEEPAHLHDEKFLKVRCKDLACLDYNTKYWPWEKHNHRYAEHTTHPDGHPTPDFPIGTTPETSFHAYSQTFTGRGQEFSEERENDVYAVYINQVNNEIVYSADVTWGSMEFSFRGDIEREWNADTHTYVDKDVTGAHFECEEGANEVTITNHSNAPIVTNVKFDTKIKTISGEIVAKDESKLLDMDKNDKTRCVLNAGAEGKYDEADSVTYELTLDGTYKQDQRGKTTLGTVTVTFDAFMSEYPENSYIDDMEDAE